MPATIAASSSKTTPAPALGGNRELEFQPLQKEEKHSDEKTSTKSLSANAAPFSFSFPSQSSLGGGGFSGFSFSQGQDKISFPTFPITPIVQTSSQAQQQEEDNDDEGEPILPPEKILKNENDTDEILLEVPCKLFGFNTEDKEWKDSGKGSFRVTADPSSGKKRMLVRNTMGKITFNAGFYRSMKIDQVKGGIKMLAVVAQAKDPSKTEMKSFMIKLKEADISTVKPFLEEIIRSLE